MNVSLNKKSSGRPYLVEISRISRGIESSGLADVDLSVYTYVTNVSLYSGEDDFFAVTGDYAVREIGGKLYRFDYEAGSGSGNIRYVVNGIIAAASAGILLLLLYVYREIIVPFDRMKELPRELARGRLTMPMKQGKSRYFGEFFWGIDLLRESIEQQKNRELELLRERKRLHLSLLHDIKNPLLAIKLYSKALARGLYSDRDKQIEAAESIDRNADEIESFVSQMVSSSREDFFDMEVCMGEFYLSHLINRICSYNSERFRLSGVNFSIQKIPDCLLRGDPERAAEVLQNIIENAVKYGDGKLISVSFSEEEGCILIAVKNSGCTLSESEQPHIFESFWRGSNSGNAPGCGLGLFICRRLMNKMGGDIFASSEGGYMTVTSVFPKS